MTDVDEWVQYALDFGKRANIVSVGDNLLVITGERKGAGSFNTM